MSEKHDAEVLANRVLDEPNADPDDGLRLLARQYLRRGEVISRLEAKLIEMLDPHLDLVNANRDTILRIHEDGTRLIGKVMIGGSDTHDREKLLYIGKVLHAINSFHPMHGESWIGWPTEKPHDLCADPNCKICGATS